MTAPRLRLRVIPEVDPGRLYVSTNDKTGYSINTPIAETCRPTEACAKYCYGNTGRISMSGALRRQYENFVRFQTLERASKRDLEDEADRVFHAVYPQQTFLRFFGVGDLTPGAVRLINVLAKRHPRLALWVATRKLELAKKLVRSPNLHIMVSLDASTKGDEFHEYWNFIQARGPLAFAAYVQQHKNEAVPKWAEVIFAEHKPGGNRAPWTEDSDDWRLCPATVVDGADHNGACFRCRYCFTVERRAKGRP